MICTFQQQWQFAPLIGQKDDDMDIETMTTTYNKVVTDAANEISGKERRRKKPGPQKMFSTSVMKVDLKKRQCETEGAKANR